MPGCRCAVKTCLNSRGRTKRTGDEISYHRFPNASADPSLSKIRQEWIYRCCRGAFFTPALHTICSIHFESDSFERDLRNELLGLPVRKKLKKTAVPTLNLPEQILISVPEEIEFISVPDDPDMNHLNSFLTNYDLSQLQEKYAQLQEKYDLLNSDFINLKRTSTARIKSLNSALKYYKEKCVRMQQPSKQDTEALGILKSIFTENQINILSKKRKFVKWTREEIVNAMTIRHLSEKCYIFLRNKLNFPLPGLSSLQRWNSLISDGDVEFSEAL